MSEDIQCSKREINKFAAFSDVLYPKEIIDVMAKVLAGEWEGPNPEDYIDALLHDFINHKVPDRQRYVQWLAEATKQLGCLHCVLARLNLELLLQPDLGDTIVIRTGRRHLLPGENHGPFCNCEACLGGRLGSADDINPDDPYALSTDEMADLFYAGEEVIYRRPPKPSLSQDRKLEIHQWLRNIGYDIAEDREAAYERLEKLLHGQPLEHSIIGRLAYLLVFDALRKLDSRPYLAMVTPKMGMLPYKNH